MFTLFILIFVVTSLCAHNEQSVKCNKPFDIFANIQTLPQLLWFTKPPPQVMVPSRQFSELPQLAGLDFLLYYYYLGKLDWDS